MAKRVQHIRHNTAGANAFLGLSGEFTYVTDTGEIRAHDGSNAGGARILTLTQNDARYLLAGVSLEMEAGTVILIRAGVLDNVGLGFVGDPNTGLYQTDVGTFGLVADGEEILTIAATGLTLTAGNSFTLAATATMDVSAGTLTLADDQISGDKIHGGVISGNVELDAPTITGGVSNATTLNDPVIDGGTIANLATPLAVADGGTGAITLPAYRILLGNAVAAVDAVVSVGTSGQYLKSNGAGARPSFEDFPAAVVVIPAGTDMLFYEATAPTGWTQNAAVNDRVIRVVSGAGGTATGGSWTFSGISVDGHAITAAQMPGHAHTYSGSVSTDGSHTHTITTHILSDNAGVTNIVLYENLSATTELITINASGSHNHTYSGSTSTEGDGSTHTHGLTIGSSWRPAYVDMIICTKNA